MLLSHLSGIRHYEKDIDKIREDKAKAKQPLKHPVTEKQEKKNKDKPSTDHCHKDSPQAAKKKEFDHEEYYLKENFESVTQALNLFKDDPLVFEPGKQTKKKVVKFSTFLKEKFPITDLCFSTHREYFPVLHSRLHPAQCRHGACRRPAFSRRHDEHVP